MYDYVRFGVHVATFWHKAVYAAITHPALMSAKILNASAWDDLKTTGNINDIALQQCQITRRLLNEALSDRHQCFGDATVSALNSLALFDVRSVDPRGYLAGC